VVIVLCCIVAYLWAIGLPDPVTQALIRRVGTGPFQVTIDRLRVDPFHGLVADGLRLFESGADPKSLLRVERLGLDLDWRALAREEFSLREVRVSNGTLRWPEVERAGKPVEMEKFCATVGISTGVIRIADLSMTAFGAPLAGQGVILYEPRAEPRRTGSALAGLVVSRIGWRTPRIAAARQGRLQDFPRRPGRQ
jgi:hypothetical protein